MKAYEKGLKKKLLWLIYIIPMAVFVDHHLFRELVGAPRCGRRSNGTLRILLVLIVGLFLHYTLPQRDVVRIINTYNKLTPIGSNWMFYSIEDTGTGAEDSAHPRHPVHRSGLSRWRDGDGLPQ